MLAPITLTFALLSLALAQSPSPSQGGTTTPTPLSVKHSKGHKVHHKVGAQHVKIAPQFTHVDGERESRPRPTNDSVSPVATPSTYPSANSSTPTSRAQIPMASPSDSPQSINPSQSATTPSYASATPSAPLHSQVPRAHLEGSNFDGHVRNVFIKPAKHARFARAKKPVPRLHLEFPNVLQHRDVSKKFLRFLKSRFLHIFLYL